MTAAAAFDGQFAALTGFSPFCWQKRLFQAFLDGGIPDCLDLPTGLGKTSVMAVWYLAVKAGAKLPRRLVYVVDRRAVVDQATAEAERIKARYADLRISTLRGQHADNRDWLADPAAPAIIVGTVDMIGSRLLFSGLRGVGRSHLDPQASCTKSIARSGTSQDQKGINEETRCRWRVARCRSLRACRRLRAWCWHLSDAPPHAVRAVVQAWQWRRHTMDEGKP